MVSPNANANGQHQRTPENIAYVRQMLGELRELARRDGAEMLCYLIEMAFVEAGDIQAGQRPVSITHGEGNKSPGMTV
jgi:hypothetical protein